MTSDNLLLRCEEAILRADRLQAENEKLRLQAQRLGETAASLMGRNLQLLAAITHQRRHRAAPTARPFADHTTAHLQTVALLHQRLAAGEEAIPVRSFLAEVCANLPVPEASDPNIRVRFHADPIVLAPDPAVALGLVASELVMNSYRFGFRQRHAGEIRVKILRHGTDRASLTVADSGPGLSEQFRKGSGFAIVEALAHSLEGDVVYQTGSAGGVSVRFAAPGLEAA